MVSCKVQLPIKDMGHSQHASGSTMWLHYIWYRIKIRYQINTVPTPTVAWTRAWLYYKGEGGTGRAKPLFTLGCRGWFSTCIPQNIGHIALGVVKYCVCGGGGGVPPNDGFVLTVGKQDWKAGR